VLDGYVADSADLNEVYVTRTKKNPEDWEVVGKTGLTDEMRQFGTYLNANTVCVLMKT
jgi:ABC-type amino acid transport substrate-binding protein